MVLKDWKKTGLPNSWKNKKEDNYVHAFLAHKQGVPQPYWIVRAGNGDKELIKGQKKFKTEKLAMNYAKAYMRKH